MPQSLTQSQPATTQPPPGDDAVTSIAALAAIHAFNPAADPLLALPDVHPARIPRHIAIIMDGNGRWATQRGFPRQFGHVNGAASVRTVLEECVRLGVQVLTLYSFSLENWKRPADEVKALMDLCQRYIDGEEQEMLARGIRFRTIGRREGLPAPVLESIDRVSASTAHNRACTLNLAINYGSRDEIADAARALAQRVASGDLSPEHITPELFAQHLYTAGLPDPDLLIRTAGEMRVSNYLLWQISYAEIVVTPTLWPDFTTADLHQAIRTFAARERKFGAVIPVNPLSS
jgi:undecaprenyl diphosphate synthase